MEKILRRPEVESLVGLSRSAIYAMMATGDFPHPIKLGKRAVGWQVTELSKWCLSRKTARDRDLEN